MKNAPNRANDSGAFEQLSLLPELEFKPTLPSLHSREWLALGEMLQGKALEQPEWLARTGSWRLAATIKELGYLGWQPVSILVHRHGFKRPIARYSLGQAFIRLGNAMLAELSQ
ncbi:MAG: hypothetical protein IV107_08050 [Paucibacter sp.]|nr:hypothetical protein [Roseateles sp.]